jgi:hypothetical protein
VNSQVVSEQMKGRDDRQPVDAEKGSRIPDQLDENQDPVMTKKMVMSSNPSISAIERITNQNNVNKNK